MRQQGITAATFIVVMQFPEYVEIIFPNSLVFARML